jgi:hypothetical protein
MKTATPARLDDLPLWRLLVALDDAERALGPGAPTTRVLAQAVQKKLRLQPDAARRPRQPSEGGPTDAA